jgi:hypothetical protein
VGEIRKSIYRKSDPFGFKENFIFRLMAALIWLSLEACSEKSEEPAGIKVPIQAGKMVLICNEGNYRSGNASAGLLNLATGEWDENAFKTFTGRALGDVCQSATLWNGAWWMVVNNSGKIEIVSKENFAPVKTIEGITSPRFLLPASETKAYLTDLYANKLWIVDGQAMAITGSVAFPGWGEELLQAGGKVWVVNRRKNKLFGLNPATDTWADSIAFPGNLSSIAPASQGRIWVGFEGNSGTAAGISLFNTLTGEKEKTWLSNQTAMPFAFQSSVSGDSLFFIQNQVMLLKIQDAEWPVADVLDGKTGNFYGLGYDPERRELWASDARDYQQKSRIYRKDLKNGSLREQTGGTISSRFYFW